MRASPQIRQHHSGRHLHAVDREAPPLLIDEADNLGLAFNRVLRAVLNSGHRRGGKVTRYHGGQARSFSTFAPVAVAAIGTLPLPVRSCSARSAAFILLRDISDISTIAASMLPPRALPCS